MVNAIGADGRQETAIKEKMVGAEGLEPPTYSV